MFNNSKSRVVLLLALAGVNAFALLVAPGLAMVYAGLFAIVGIVVAVAFLFDWVKQGDEDLDAARRQQNAEHARDLSNDIH